MSEIAEEMNFRELQESMQGIYKRPGFKIRRLQQISEAIFNDSAADLSVTTTQYGILYVLERIGEADQITVARLMSIDRSTAGLVIEFLEKRGLVARKQDDKDRRRRILRLTEKGRALVADLPGPTQRAVDRFLDCLPRKSQKRLISLFQSMVPSDPEFPELAALQRRVAPLMERPGFLVRRLHQQSVAMFLKQFGDVDLTPTRFGLLFAIAANGPIDQITLGRLLAIDRSTVAMVTRQLGVLGLIEKAVDANDRRRRTLRITEAGRQVLATTQDRAHDVAEELLSPLSDDDRAWLLSTMDKLIARHEPRFQTVQVSS